MDYFRNRVAVQLRSNPLVTRYAFSIPSFTYILHARYFIRRMLRVKRLIIEFRIITTSKLLFQYAWNIISSSKNKYDIKVMCTYRQILESIYLLQIIIELLTKKI